MAGTLALRSTLRSVSRAPRFSATRFSSTSTLTPVNLEYILYEPPSRSTDEPLVILPGLFAGKRTWAGFAKMFAEQLRMPVYVLDLRNQGESPHARPMTYPHMASDVIHFLKQHNFSNPTLMGHCIGGKVAMTVAFQTEPTRLVENLIVVDAAPQKGKLFPKAERYLDGMRILEEEELSSKEEAMEFMKEYEPNITMRHIILSNLLPITPTNPVCKFRIPLDIIQNTPNEKKFTGPALFVAGRTSNQIGKYLPRFGNMFPCASTHCFCRPTEFVANMVMHIQDYMIMICCLLK
ncbi:Alpha/Beta hydrolase protein [Cyathus striatus]|nr:Alpha/Beta hydrolase protein [Cyathus striatus]